MGQDLLRMPAGSAVQLELDEPRFKMPNQQISATTDEEAFETWLKTRATWSKHTYDSYQRVVRRFYDWLRNTKNLTLRQVTGDVLADYRLFLGSLDEQYKNDVSYIQDVSADWGDIRWRNVDKGGIPKHSFNNAPPLFAKRKRSGMSSENGRTGKSMFLGQRSIAYNMQVLGAFLRFLAKVGYLPFDPTVSLPRNGLRKNQADRYFAVEDWDVVFKALSKMEPEETQKGYERVCTARARWLFALGYLTGLRRSEIISAKMCDIVRSKNRFVLKVWGKGRNKDDPHDYDRLLLSDACMSELNRYREALGLPAHTGMGEDRPLVANLGRRPADALKHMSVSGVRKIFIETRTKLIGLLMDDHPALAQRLEKSTLHWLRHTGGSHMLQNGLQLEEAQQWFRHKDVGTTLIYTHHEEDALHNAFNSASKLPGD